MKKIFMVGMLSLASFASQAAVITYNDFSDTTGLAINGDAFVNGNELRLTSNSSGVGGSVFTQNAISLLDNSSFAAAFSFRISNNSNNGGDGDGPGADGLAFVVQTNSSNVGAAGGGLGYIGIDNSVAIEFDTYDNGAGDSFSGNHVGIGINGDVNTLFNVIEPARFNDGDIWDVTVSYDGLTDVLNVVWGSQTANTTGGSISQIIDLTGVLGTSDAFLGFTAATGFFSSTHDILSASFSNTSNVPETTAVSEPATLGFILSALAGLALRRKRQV